MTPVNPANRPSTRCGMSCAPAPVAPMMPRMMGKVEPTKATLMPEMSPTRKGRPRVRANSAPGPEATRDSCSTAPDSWSTSLNIRMLTTRPTS